MKPRDQIYQWFELNRARSPEQRIVRPGPFLPLQLVAEGRVRFPEPDRRHCLDALTREHRLRFPAIPNRHASLCDSYWRSSGFARSSGERLRDGAQAAWARLKFALKRLPWGCRWLQRLRADARPTIATIDGGHS